MILVTINGTTKEYKDLEESWLNEQINRRRRDGSPICVQVNIKKGNIDVLLSTPGCAGGGGTGRAPTAQEQELFDLWAKRHLDNSEFTGGNLIAFLKQVKSLA